MLLEGRPVKSCTMFGVQADGREVTTVEGLSGGQLHPIQAAFKEEHGLQCGYCTPGMMLVGAALLDENPSPTEDEVRWAISGNICRCTGYMNIVKAIQAAGRTWPRSRAPPTPVRGELRGISNMATEVEEIRGIGHSVRRMEDDRFIRGAGNYIDDINLPGMLYMAILRSPYAHAKLNGIDASGAQALEGVIAVVTGELMAQHNLAWMPTLSGDTEAVLVTDKVRFQGQEVAAVIATDPYIAKDALELIDVDYEPLGVVVSPDQAKAAGAPLIRDEKEGQTDNHIYHWESGDQEATDAAFAQADKIVSLDTWYPRSHPSPLETCGCIADVNPATGQATIYMTSQAPQLIRTVFALVAGLPEEKIRIVSPDIGGGFGNKVPVYPGYVVATAASLLLGHPVKWIEERSENLISTGFARDFWMRGEMALKADGTMTGLRVSLDADEGAFHADAQPSKLKVGLFHIVSGSYDLPSRARDGRRLLHEQGAGRRRVPVLVPRDRGLVHDRAPRAERRLRDRHGSGRAPQEELHPEGPVPLQERDGIRVRLGRLPGRDGPGAREGGLRAAAQGAGRGARAGPPDRDRARELHRGRGRRPAQGLRHPRDQDERRGRAPRAPHRQGAS